MKKTAVLLLAGIMACSLAACGQKEEATQAPAAEAAETGADEGEEVADTGTDESGSAEVQESTGDGDTWILAINATFPPFESIADSTDDYVGIDIDLAEYIADKLGLQLEIQDMQFSALVPTMQSGRADVIISGISPTAERLEILDFTDSYYYPMNAIICAEGSNYDTLDTLVGKSVGVSMGTSYAGIAASVDGAEVKELDSTPLVIQEILSNRCDAGIFDATQAAVFVQENEGLEMHIIESEITREDSFAIALPKDSEYVDQINEILAEMMEDGTFHDILVKYIGEDSTSQYEEMLKSLDAANE